MADHDECGAAHRRGPSTVETNTYTLEYTGRVFHEGDDKNKCGGKNLTWWGDATHVRDDETRRRVQWTWVNRDDHLDHIAHGRRFRVCLEKGVLTRSLSPWRPRPVTQGTGD